MIIWGGFNHLSECISGILGEDYLPMINRCLNEITSIQSWKIASNMIPYCTFPIYHVSAGKFNNKTCTLFFYNYENNARIISVNKHVGKTGSEYKTIWQLKDFKLPSIIKL